VILKYAELEAIKSGKVTLAFRRWVRPSVKTGGTLKTAIGVLAIDRVARVERFEITERDAAAAGSASLTALLATLDSRDGDLYRVEVRFAGADPRVRLREEADLDAGEVERLRKRLDRLDAASPVGAWTRKVLRTIERHPYVVAASLAKLIGFEKERLKTNIRKLKELGLTISHERGYELSPRGKALLEHLNGDA
jgi:biotin operon repressor